MGTPTPTPAKQPDDKAAAKQTASNAKPLGFESTGPDFVQPEPKPEDMPANAKVTPPMEQVNPALAQSVGTGGEARLDDMDEAVQEGVKLHAESVEEATERAQDVADARRKLDDASK